MSNTVKSHVVGEKETPLHNLTIGQLLENAVKNHASNTAIVSSHQDVSWNYTQFNEVVSDFSKGLIDLGLKPGDRIGIWSPNNVEWVVTMYAAAKAGLILVNINPAYRPSELEYALNKVGCKALVLADKFKTSNYPNMLKELAPEISTSTKGELNAKQLPELRSMILIGDQKLDGFYNFADIQNLGKESSADLASVATQFTADDPINIQFTSGTTGSPKGATLTHNNIVNNGFFVGKGIALTSEDKLCCPVPLYHCFGMVMATLACANYGATLVLPDEAFDPLTTLKAVEKEKCTALYGVPTMFNMILNHPEFANISVDTLRTGIVAGALCPTALMEQIIGELNMKEVTNCYGMTETSPVSFQTKITDSFEKKVTTVGRVLPHVEVKVVDADGNTTNRGERGEICTKGYSVMRGYWGDVEKTDESIQDGWMHTGDEGVLDDEGFCCIVGRIKDTIIRGGENIAPKEIEDYLYTHDSIQDAQIFGLPDETFGEVVCAWVKLKEGCEMTEEELQAFCKGTIAHYKVPAFVRFVDEYPMTVTGKIQKFKMRDAMAKELAV